MEPRMDNAMGITFLYTIESSNICVIFVMRNVNYYWKKRGEKKNNDIQ
jgi:hypothetical protein